MKTRPVTVSLRLEDFDPKAVALDVVERVRHQGAYLLRVGGGEPRRDEAERPCVLGDAVERLTRYAQSGDVDDPASMPGEIDLVMGALYSCAGDAPRRTIEDVDMNTPIGLVLVAANARVMLAQKVPGAGLTPRELAALAGLSPSHVRGMASNGTAPIEFVGGVCPTAKAKAWLDARGVVGLDGPPVKADPFSPELSTALRGVTLHPILRNALIKYSREPGMELMTVAEWRAAITTITKLPGALLARPVAVAK